jgi:predicted RNA-binding protein with RPS1 domain
MMRFNKHDRWTEPWPIGQLMMSGFPKHLLILCGSVSLSNALPHGDAALTNAKLLNLLLHVPQIRNVSDVLHEGDAIQVKCLGRDVRGLVRLSLKALTVGTEAVGRKQSSSTQGQQLSKPDSQHAAKHASSHKHSGQARHLKEKGRPRH